ncbi:MAG: Gfo/Idh/MocA family oxidoreductase [Candidatus Pacebacteria bacterium]|nr:Gfo/Idh/MocA family oxidoreductase [Candidatus Paceibacterota bacterium]
MIKKNIAIIGLGKQGAVHFDAALKLQEEGKINLLAICDKDKMFIKKMAKMYKIDGFSNYKDLISKYEKDLDLLILCLPNNVYSEVILDCLNKKCIVLKEKPFASSLSEAATYEFLQEEKKIIIRTAQQRFFTKAYIFAKKCIDSGLIGKPLFFEYQYSLNDERESWYWNKGAGGGCWLNVGWHMIFVIIWFFGNPDIVNVSKIRADKRCWKYDTDDSVMFSCKYDSGLVGNGFISVADTFKEKSFKIVGDKGYLIIIKNKLTLYNNEDEIIKEIEDEGESEIYKRQILDILKGGKRISQLEKYNIATMKIINSY